MALSDHLGGESWYQSLLRNCLDTYARQGFSYLASGQVCL